MLNNQERELKVLLTREQYEKLLNSYDFNSPVLQKNTYYDSANEELKNKKIGLRIRMIGNQNILTVKKPKDSITKYEYEFPISDESISIENLHPSERDHLESIIHVDQPVYPTVVFETVRYNLQTQDATISLDQTDFDGHRDYELEYEYLEDHDGISKLYEFLKPIGIQYEKNGPSKLARAFQYKNQDKENL